MYPELDMQLPASRTIGTVLDENHPQRRYYKSGHWRDEDARSAIQRADEIYMEIIPIQNDLRGDISLFPHNESPEEKARLKELINLMTSSSYKDIAARICQQFGKNFDKTNGG